MRLAGRAKHFYRCGCGALKSMRKAFEEYIRPPMCGCCGRRDDWRLDNYRYNQWRQRKGVYKTCHCLGLNHAHRRGTEGCYHANT